MVAWLVLVVIVVVWAFVLMRRSRSTSVVDDLLAMRQRMIEKTRVICAGCATVRADHEPTCPNCGAREILPR